MGYAVLDECQLQRSTAPLLAQQILERQGYVLWFALVEYSHQHLELFGVEATFQHCFWDVTIFDFAKVFKNLVPVQVGVKFSEGSRQILDAPGHESLLVFWLLLDGGRVAIFVGFEGIVNNFGDMIIFALMVNGQLKYGLCHDLLVYAFELKECLVEEVIHVRSIVSNVNQDLPWLEYLVNEFQMLKSKSILQNVVGRQVKMGIDLGDVLVQRRSQRCELTVPVCICLDYE